MFDKKLRRWVIAARPATCVEFYHELPGGNSDFRSLQYYYALYRLDDVGPGQLPLTQGQVVLVIYTCDLENNPEWWFVEDRYGKQGYVPASYLRKYKAS